jgi:hypothetical protein
VEWVFPDNPDPLSQHHFHPITDAKIAKALKNTSNTSAPGKSGLSWKLVKWAWEVCPEWFVTLFSACLFTGIHLKAWKMAMIALVPKPSKTDFSLLKSYRLMALLKCLGKLIVMRRILDNVRAFNLVPTNQFGAHLHSLIIHTGLALTSDISTAHTKGSCCSSLQLDIQGFFNNINHDRLIHTF